MGGIIAPEKPKADKGLMRRQKEAEERERREANRLRQRAAAALRSSRAAGAGADLAFAGPTGLAETVGAGGVRAA